MSGETLHRSHENYLDFFCPGCDEGHRVRIGATAIDPKPHPIWTWNGDMVRPTFGPSYLLTGEETCHSYVIDGQIQFLNDCTHALAGKTVPLPIWEGWEKGKFFRGD